MSNQKKNLRFWLIFAILLAVALAAITVAHRWHRIFPSNEVSELYTRYAGVEGMEVSFAKDYRVNDTLRVDVTLIETSDNNAWDYLCQDLHIASIKDIPEEYRELFISNSTFEHFIKEDPLTPDSDSLMDLYVYSRKQKSVCVFHSLTEKQYDAIIDNEIDKINK